ncbi:TetR family transcriptional regulator [Salsuginibacillus halophilus]|uniref:TetR family transcriptional regulator n=1 Tax=Salsuginibacillus halophilus TaxID=517424 RepID=A0A2P8HXL6_9BACI|nr:TetR/AcrR family transcriptional regulator [Salsuginibacillus halophilus]PSL50971.1 TetR family transcriptional regulator [Salsuginibacillus halophilus]
MQSSVKTRIIEAALRLFEERGFHSVTVDAVVQESETSKGGFYYYFNSKDELLYTIHDAFITFVLDKAEEAAAKTITPAEQLYETVRSFVMMFEKYRAHVTVFYQENTYLGPAYAEKMKEKRDQYKQTMFSIVKRGKLEGEFRSELPVPITSMAIFGMINWTYKWYKSDGKYTVAEIADIFADLIMRAVLTQESLNDQKYQSFFIAENS